MSVNKEREKVEARLRKEQDADLRSAIVGISSGELSELVRDGLRLMLGIRTKKTTQVVEKPVQVHSIPSKVSVPGKAASIPGKPLNLTSNMN